MGGAVSSGRDNNELIDNLMGGGYIRTRSVERVFRVLDRADYMTPTERDQAYKDLAWRSGALHLSAPCIYSEVMEALELKPGLSFLNLGSGTGYLTTLAGLIIGSGGISHGVEIHPGVVEYSTKKLSQFQENSVTLDEFDFCIPKYYCGNALCLAPLQTLYDRVYVGAGVLPKYENYFKQLIKVSGVLVMPLGDTLVQIQRVSETEWSSRQLLNVSFALLRAPTKEESAEPIKLDELVPVSLMILCRASIRHAMLGGVCRRHPELKEPAPRRPPVPRPRPRRICIPLDPDTDDPSMNELHDMEGRDGGREMNALLSLVLSMGNNRVAGSLRFGDERDRRPGGEEELEVLIDEIDHGSESSSDGSEYRARSPAPAPPSDARPSAAGAAGASRHTERRSRGPVVPAALGAGTHVRAPGEAVPRAQPGGTDLSALTAAGRVECDESEDVSKPTAIPDTPDVKVVHESGSGSDDSKPSTSGKCPGVARSTKDAPAVPLPGPSVGSGPVGENGLSGDSGPNGDSGPSGDSGPNGDNGSSADSGASGDSGLSGGNGFNGDSGPNGGSGSGSGSGGSGPSGGSGGTKRGGGDGGDGGPRVRRRIRVPIGSSRRRANASAMRTKRFPPEVQIYFGNAGVYDRSDVVQHESEDEAGNASASASEDVHMDDQLSSSDDESPCSSKDKKRQKLDSGIGEGTASCSNSSTPQSASPEESDGRDSSYTDASATDNQDTGSTTRVPRRRRVAALRRGGDSDSDTPAAAAARRARRSTHDARRVRLSIVMKRGIKELPLPHALKKFVNLHRCFEF